MEFLIAGLDLLYYADSCPYFAAGPSLEVMLLVQLPVHAVNIVCVAVYMGGYCVMPSFGQ